MATSPRLSPSMFRALTNLHRGRPIDDHVFGRSACGGFGATILALSQRGLIDSSDEGRTYALTETGAAARQGEIERQARPRRRVPSA